MVIVPVVDNTLGRVGFVLQLEADEACQFVEVVDYRSLFAGYNFLIHLVGALHIVEKHTFLVAELNGCAMQVFGEAGWFEIGHTFEKGLLLAGDGDIVVLVQLEAFGIDQLVGIAVLDHLDAVGREVEQGGDAVATAAGDHMDGRRGHAEDGMHLVEGDGVLGHETLLAQTHLLAFLCHLAGGGGAETEHSGDGGAGQDADAAPEEFEAVHGRVVYGGRNYLAQMVRLDNIHHIGFRNTALTQEVDGRHQRRTAGELGHIELQHSEEAQLTGTGFDGKLDGDRRFVAFLQFNKKGVEMVNGGIAGFDGVAVGVAAIHGDEVAGHDFLAENVAIALNLSALAGAAVAAVEHAGVRIVVTDGPHHALEDKRGESLFALHEGENEILVLGIESLHVFHQLGYLIEGIGEKQLAVIGTAYFLLELGNTLHLLLGAEGDIGGLIFAFHAQHLAKSVEGGEVDTIAHTGVVGTAERLVGLTGNTHIEQCGHKSGDVLRHSATDGKHQRMMGVAENVASHHLKILDSLTQSLHKVFGVLEPLGGENHKVGHGIAVTGQFDKHPSLITNLRVGELPFGKSRDKLIVLNQLMGGHVFIYLFFQHGAVGSQRLELLGGGGAVVFGQEEPQVLLSMLTTCFEQLIHIVPTGRELVLGVVAIELIDDGARFVAFEGVVHVVYVAVEHLRPALRIAVQHLVVLVTCPD